MSYRLVQGLRQLSLKRAGPGENILFSKDFAVFKFLLLHKRFLI
jgi:hypothetical protein